MADKAALVEQVKQVQRQGFASKQAWWNFCDTHLERVKDPNKHDEATLQDFLTKLQAGELPTHAPANWSHPQQQSWGAGPCGGGNWAAPQFGGGRPFGTGIGLASAISRSQSKSSHFKSAWENYITLWGDASRRDPNGYDEAFLTGFLDYLGQMGSMNLQSQAAANGVNLEQGQMAGGNGYAMGNNGFDGAGNKRAASEFGELGAPMKRAATAQDWAASPPVSGEDAEKANMVDHIKKMQRADESMKQAWGQYCDQWLGGVRDPNSHELHVLQQFVAEHGGGASF